MSPVTEVDVATLDASIFDITLEPDILTDKDNTKTLPCRDCKRACVVTKFMTPAKVVCRACVGDTDGDSRGTVGVPIPGQTDPAKAKNLADCLVNPTFANALCPVHPDDEDHAMEIKNITHHPHHGPSVMVGYKNNIPEYRQTATGETVMLQCAHCKATVSYSTTAQSQFRAQNEPKENGGQGTNAWSEWLGVREEGQPSTEDS